MITGASSGIGRGLAVELGRRGAKLGLVARRANVLEEVIREIEAVGSKAVAVPADVQDAGSMSAAAEKVRAELGPVDILIANAGIGPTRDAAEISAEEIAGVINVKAQRAVGSDIEFGCLPWSAKVGRILRQQSRGFSVFRKSAA